MEDAQTLLNDLRAAGFSLRADGGKLLLAPASQLSPEQRKAVKEHRDALLALLVEEEEWERTTALLAQHPPDFSSGPVQMVEAVLVRWADGTPAAVLPLEEWAGMERWAATCRARREAEKGCPHKDTALWRRGPHVMERCSTCGANARGPGKWVPLAEVEDLEALPWLPGYAPEPTTDLFSQGGEEC